MRVSAGGGNPQEGEVIEVVEMDVDEARNLYNAKEANAPPSFLYGLGWFLINKCVK